MSPKSKEPKPDEREEPVPFDEALRRLVSTPPKHKPAKEKTKKRDAD